MVSKRLSMACGSAGTAPDKEVVMPYNRELGDRINPGISVRIP